MLRYYADHRGALLRIANHQHLRTNECDGIEMKAIMDCSEASGKQALSRDINDARQPRVLHRRMPVLLCCSILIPVLIISFTVSSSRLLPNVMEKKPGGSLLHRSLDFYSEFFDSSSASGTEAGVTLKPKLQIAWLMSFPNSGTSYTLNLVSTMTKTRVGTNYGGGQQQRESVPVFDDQPGGPFWLTTVETPKFTLPTKFVLTKTHCTRYCFSCPPQDYEEARQYFRNGCLSGLRMVASHDNGKLVRENVVYPSDKIKKAIHLIRDPFDNIVSRFHLQVRTGKINDSNTDDRAAFRNYCTELNKKFDANAHDVWFLDEKILEVSKIIPCRADFFRYVQWHNYAFVTAKDLQLDTFVLHYESYMNGGVEEIAAQLAKFLELNITSRETPFEEGKVYRNVYYSAEEQEAVRTVIEAMASEETWSNLKMYFS